MHESPAPPDDRPARVLRDAALIGAACALVALVVNAVRAGGIPLVRREPYPILVPCPEVRGEVTEIDAADPSVRDPATLLVDARPRHEHERWHLERAVNVPYDWLEPVAPAEVRAVAASLARRVVVYGDGLDPDSGRQLGVELSSKGIRNVLVVRGGAPALGSLSAVTPAPGSSLP
jgi:hypothetical protein